jgi:hypothetical protein
MSASPERDPSPSRNIYAFGITSLLNNTQSETACPFFPACLATLEADRIPFLFRAPLVEVLQSETLECKRLTAAYGSACNFPKFGYACLIELLP